MDERTISRLVTGKAKKYLRTATLLLIISLGILATFLVIVERQREQQATDFRSNENVHVIEALPGSTGSVVGRMTFGDLADLRAELRSRHGDGVSVTGRYELGFGIPDADGLDRFIYGLDGDAGRLLGLPQVEEGVAYTTEAEAGSIELRIPVVDATGAGMTSATAVPRTLGLAGGVSASSPLLVLGRPSAEALYVDGATFREVVEVAFDTDWETFTSGHDGDNPFGIEAVRSAYVYVDDLEAVDAVAGSVEDLGFATNYTLKAFDDLAGSLRTTTQLGLAAVLAVFVACAIYIFLSFNSYMNLAHRDMGILRHYGFPAAAVRRMFARRVGSLSRLVGAVVAAYTIALGLAALPSDALVPLTALNLAVVAALLGGVYAVTTQWIFRRHAARDVLTLLKLDREFE